MIVQVHVILLNIYYNKIFSHYREVGGGGYKTVVGGGQVKFLPLQKGRGGGTRELKGGGGHNTVWGSLETEYRLFPPVTIFLDLFLRVGCFSMLLTETSETPKV